MLLLADLLLLGLEELFISDSTLEAALRFIIFTKNFNIFLKSQHELIYKILKLAGAVNLKRESS